MNCAFHSHNAAVVNCNGCGKSLCPACDHRIKGFPYCQDCIVTGVELLRNHYQSNYVPVVKRQTSPWIAMLLSLPCPGLGAAYNGQTIKAIVYFAVFVGLFQMWILTEGTAIFRWGVIGMYLFSALDAWRTAQMIRSGLTPDGAEDILVKRFSGNPKLWGIILSVLGILFVLQAQNFFDVRLLMRGVLPVALIGLGLYLLREQIFKKKVNAAYRTDFSSRQDAPNFVSAITNPEMRNENFETQSDFSSRMRGKSWKNR